MPAARMEHTSGICCVTVSFLYSYSIPKATGRALCSCQATRMQHLLLSCQQILAVKTVCLAQEDQCRFSSLCGTGLPAGLETPRPCFLVLGSAWIKVKRLLLIHSSSRCNSMAFSNWKHLLDCLNWSLWSQGYWGIEGWDSWTTLPGSCRDFCDGMRLFLLKSFIWVGSHSLLCSCYWFSWSLFTVCSDCRLYSGKGADTCFFVCMDHLTDATFQHWILKSQRWFM